MSVDARQVDTAMRGGIPALSTECLLELCDLMVGDFVEGLDLARSPQLDHWLAGQRRHYRTCLASLLERLIELMRDDPTRLRQYADRWVALSPLDMRAQIILLRTLMEGGKPEEAERHFAAINRLFSTEKIGIEPIRRVWRELQASHFSLPVVPAVALQPQPRSTLDGSGTESRRDGYRRARSQCCP